jgi:hypothetical protein
MFSNFNAADDRPTPTQNSALNSNLNGNYLKQKDPLADVNYGKMIPDVHGTRKKIFKRNKFSALKSRDPKFVYNELESEIFQPIRKVNIGSKPNMNLP